MKTGKMTALMCAACLIFSGIGALPVGADTGEDAVLAAIKEADEKSERYAISTKKLGIQATGVKLQDEGYCSLKYEVIEDEYGYDPSKYSERKIAMIDRTGKFLFPYKQSFFLDYYYRDGVVSMTDNNFWYGITYRLDEPECVEFYSIDGNVLFEHEPYFSSTIMLNHYAAVYTNNSEHESKDAYFSDEEYAYAYRKQNLIDNTGKTIFALPDDFIIWHRDSHSDDKEQQKKRCKAE